jgi:hypothetical protein
MVEKSFGSGFHFRAFSGVLDRRLSMGIDGETATISIKHRVGVHFSGVLRWPSDLQLGEFCYIYGMYLYISYWVGINSKQHSKVEGMA